MSDFQPQEKVIVTLRSHIGRTRNGVTVEKPAIEMEAEFVRYHNNGKRAIVRIQTRAEGLRQQSVDIARVRKKD